MINCELVKVLPVENGLGECIVWNDATQQMYWTDIVGDKLYRYTPETDTTETFDMPENLGSFAFVEGSEDWLLAGFKSGFAKLHIPSLEVEWIWKLKHEPINRLNDGRVDRQGRFWVGSMVDTPDWTHENPEITGKLYRIDADGTVTEHKTGIKISNSICWSPCGNIMYFADSPTNNIVAWDFDAENGTISNERIVASTPKGIHPDGSIVDADGYIWNAQWGNGKVVRYSAEGEVDTSIQLPALQATCCTFGGKDLDMLYVTSANIGLDEEQLKDQPEAGAVFIYKTDAKGLNEVRFKSELA